MASRLAFPSRLLLAGVVASAVGVLPDPAITSLAPHLHAPALSPWPQLDFKYMRDNAESVARNCANRKSAANVAKARATGPLPPPPSLVSPPLEPPSERGPLLLFRW